MDKAVLAEYADMKEEIKDLRRRIDEDKRALEKLQRTIVTDSVTCGKKGKKPLRTVKIQGAPKLAIERKQNALARKRKLMELLEADLLEKQTEVEEYIQQIEKSELRIMFRFYYIDNLNWVQVAHRMNMLSSKKKRAYTEDSCRCKHNRFLDKN